MHPSIVEIQIHCKRAELSCRRHEIFWRMAYEEERRRQEGAGTGPGFVEERHGVFGRMLGVLRSA